MIEPTPSNRYESSCEPYASLLSARLDDELGPEENAKLDDHLVHCQKCQIRLKRYQQADSVIESWATVSVAGHSNSTPIPGSRTLDEIINPPAEATLPHTSPGHVPPGLPIKKNQIGATHSPTHWPRIAWRLVPVAVAATVLVCLLLVAFNTPQQADAEQITSDQFVQPMKDLHWINFQKQQDQLRMLRTLEMDLRFLKLEISGLNPESDARKSLESHIDKMIHQVNQFDSESLN